MVDSARTVDAARRGIRHGDLQSLSRLVGTGYRAVGGTLHGDATVATGRFDLQQLRPGLLVHASDAIYERTVTTRLVKQKSLNFSIVLAGGWQAMLGGTPLSCGGKEPQAMFFGLSEADVWQKHAPRGGYARMVNVMAAPEWLEGNGLDGTDLSVAEVDRLACRHRGHGQWRPSSRVIALAGQILGYSPYSGALQRLYLESRAIDIVVESLAQITDASSAYTYKTRRPADDRRMRIVRERLDSAGELPSLSELAREACVSTRTLQRQFFVAHGVGVVEYARRCRLQLARDLLEREGLTVAQAAHRAGYAHAANFATAFKRHFGVLPGQVRARL